MSEMINQDEMLSVELSELIVEELEERLEFVVGGGACFSCSAPSN